MPRVLVGTILVVGVVVSVLAGSVLAGRAQSPSGPAATGAVNRSDLAGVWTNIPAGARQLRPQLFTGREPAMTPWAEEKYRAANPTYGPRAVPVSRSNDPVYKCFPPGVPRIYFHPMPMEIVQLDDRILMLFEHDSIVRRIWLDRRDPSPSERISAYMGRSNGWWEDDVLVVETVGFNGKTWLDRMGHPTTEKMRVVERFRRVDAKTLHIDVSVFDAEAYRTPIEDQFVYTLEPSWRIAEHVCEDFVNFEAHERELTQ